MQRRVVFVQGTAYSGSTFFHLMLANDPAGFACGEVHGLFRPHVDGHVNRICSCGDPQCQLWPQVLARGEEELYASIFSLRPEVRLIVDSSKQPFWIRTQNRRLARANIRYDNILIWKTPLEFAGSKKRKGSFHNWATAWLSAHRLYLSFIPGLRTVSYHDLVNEPTMLQEVADFLEIPYFVGKERYWERSQCVLGGSNTAKYHMYEATRADALKTRSETMDKDIPYRSIRYVPVTDVDVIRSVDATLAQDDRFEELQMLLAYADVRNQDFDPAEFQRRLAGLRLPDPVVQAKRLRYHLRTASGRIRYRGTPRFRQVEST